MLDFRFSEEQKLFRESLKEFAQQELADGTAQIQKIIISREIIGKELLPY